MKKNTNTTQIYELQDVIKTHLWNSTNTYFLNRFGDKIFHREMPMKMKLMIKIKSPINIFLMAPLIKIGRQPSSKWMVHIDGNTFTYPVEDFWSWPYEGQTDTHKLKFEFFKQALERRCKLQHDKVYYWLIIFGCTHPLL